MPAVLVAGGVCVYWGRGGGGMLVFLLFLVSAPPFAFSFIVFCFSLSSYLLAPLSHFSSSWVYSTKCPTRVYVSLTHFILNRLYQTIYWKSPISILIFANSGDTDQMPHSAASDLGLHCLPITF